MKNIILLIAFFAAVFTKQDDVSEQQSHELIGLTSNFNTYNRFSNIGSYRGLRPNLYSGSRYMRTSRVGPYRSYSHEYFPTGQKRSIVTKTVVSGSRFNNRIVNPYNRNCLGNSCARVNTRRIFHE